jgi:predicted  nucleic acid-binding Zn-ribbon protein
MPAGPRPINRRQAETRRDLDDDLGGMAASLGEVDPRSARRLESLSRALRSEAGRQSWADVDLRQAFNTERLAHAYAVRREGGYVPPAVDRADKIRNVMLQLPIFLTWAALAEAVRAYQHYIAAHPEEVRLPFLLLWQQGFGEHNGIFTPKFSTLAILDAIIIFIIILLTFYSHGRREAREDAIDQTARVFQTDLDNTLAEASVALAADKAGRPAMLAQSVERLAERFDLSSQELLTRLRVEHDRLEAIAARREKEFEDFGVFASGMRAGAEEMHRLLMDLRQVSTGVQTALEDLTSEISVSGDQQRSLLTAVKSLERMVASGIQSDHAVTRQLADAAKSLSDASDKAVSGAEAASQAGRVATDAVRGVAEIASSLAASQARVEHAIATEAESNSRLAESLRGAAGGIGSSTKVLSDISTNLAYLREEFLRIGDITTQRQREISEEVASLIRRLDHLTGQFERAAGGAGLGAASAAPVRQGEWASGQGNEPYEPRQAGTGPRRDRGLWPRRE